MSSNASWRRLLRSTTGVVPTAQGKVLYEHALAADRELNKAAEQIQQLDGQMTGTLAIGAVPLAVMTLMPETLRTFGREFPDIQLRLLEELCIQQLTRLRTGEVDVAVGPVPDNLPAGEFAVEGLMPVAMVAVVGRGHPLAGATKLADLARAPWLYTGNTPASGYAKTLFERHGVEAPPAGPLVISTLRLLSVVATGKCVGLLPQQIALHPFAREHLAIVPLAEGPLELHIGAMARTEGRGATAPAGVYDDGIYQGKAPAAIVDAKAAVRYLRLNDSVMPGNAARIVVNGTSGGGAQSTQLGATGDSADYFPYLKAFGAAGIDAGGKSSISDGVYAIVAYCPIQDMGSADLAYEWMFNVLDTRALVSADQKAGLIVDASNNELVRASNPDPAGSAELMNKFVAYQASLGLKNDDGTALTTDNMLAALQAEIKKAASGYVKAGKSIVAYNAYGGAAANGVAGGSGTYGVSRSSSRLATCPRVCASAACCSGKKLFPRNGGTRLSPRNGFGHDSKPGWLLRVVASF